MQGVVFCVFVLRGPGQLVFVGDVLLAGTEIGDEDWDSGCYDFEGGVFVVGGLAVFHQHVFVWFSFPRLTAVAFQASCAAF